MVAKKNSRGGRDWAGRQGPVTLKEFKTCAVQLTRVLTILKGTIDGMAEYGIDSVEIFGWKKAERAIPLLMGFSNEVEVAMLKERQKHSWNNPVDTGVSDA